MSTGNQISSISNPLSRRDLLWLLATSGAALFGGGSLSWALQRDDAALTAEARANALAETLANSGNQITDLTQTLQAAEAEIARLAAELAQTQNQAAQYENDLANSQNALATAQSEIETLRQQLSESTERNGVLEGLVALLEGLDTVGLDDIIQIGLTALTGAWTGLGGLAPVLQAGVDLARGLLDQFDETAADLHKKVLQVGKLMDNLSLDIDRIETASAQAVLQVGPLFEPIVQFVSYLINQVPFDVSEPFEQAMMLIRRLLLSAPQSVRNTQYLLLRPFERYLGEHADSWIQSLTAPLREQVLAPAGEFLAQWTEADTTLSEQVLAPTTAALKQRSELRAEIAAYKVEHKLA